MNLTSSPTEWTTAVTDAALAGLCFALLQSLWRRRVDRPWTKRVWAAVFLCLAAGSVLGAIAHGLDLSPAVTSLLWRPLYLSLGLSVALFFVGAVSDWRGERAARALLPWALAAGLAFFVITQVSDDFLMFLVYEGVTMLATLGIYLLLWRRHRTGAGLVALGIALTLAAAAVQGSNAHATIIWEFDHNGLFHLVQMIAIVLVASGLRAGMRQTTPTGTAPVA